MKTNSPYSASMTGCGFAINEFNAVLPLFLDPNAEELIREEIRENRYLMMNSENTRKRCISEFKQRFNAVPRSFWEYYLNISDEDKRITLLYSILCAYQILKDLHLNVVQSQWLSIEKTLSKDNLMMELYNISSKDAFVDSWSDVTKNKIVSWYQTVLVQVGILQRSNSRLQTVHIKDDSWFHNEGEKWFLEACLT